MMAGLVVAAALSGCAIVDNGAEGGTEGYLSFGFEEAAFRPCGVNEQWWVDESDASIELLEAYREVAGSSSEYTRVYATLIGARSGLGSFGHEGAYDRRFSVSRVVEIRAAKGGDCTWPGQL
jgi:hypothetical protein